MKEADEMKTKSIYFWLSEWVTVIFLYFKRKPKNRNHNDSWAIKLHLKCYKGRNILC